MGGWTPDEDVLAVLVGAAGQDADAYLGALVDSCLVMPGGEGWSVVETPEGTCVVVYTSVEGMRAAIDAEAYTVWPAFDLLHAWPDPAWALLVDGGLSTEVTVEPSGIARAASEAARAYPLDCDLWRAEGDPAAYLEAVVGAEVVVPMRPEGSPSRDLADPDFAWWRIADRPGVVLFTSPPRLRARLGDVPWLIAAFADVLAHWPRGHAALVDPEHHIGAELPAAAMIAMADATRALAVRPELPG